MVFATAALNVANCRSENTRDMPYKRPPTDAEVAALAERLKPLWRTGEAMRPWLRKHGDMLVTLVHDDWSWEGIAAALNHARITYHTGNAWTGKRLNREYHRARKPNTWTLREPDARGRVGGHEPAAAAVMPLSTANQAPLPPATSPAEEPPIKLAKLRNWSG